MRVIITLLGVLLSWSGFSQNDNLIVGTLVYAPPFVVAANKNSYFGFDIELMNGICKRIQANCFYVGMPFQKLFAAVQQNVVDLAIGAISITHEREANLLFSLPYMASSGRFVTTSASHIHEMNDIRGKRIGVIAGRQYKALVQSMFLNLVTIVEYQDMTALLQGLSKNKVDVVAFSEPMAQYWVDANSDLYNIVGERFSLGIGLGIITEPADTELMTRINKALLEMEADGSYLKLYNLYFGQLTLSKEENGTEE